MSGAVLAYRRQLYQGGTQRAHKLIIAVVAAVALVACSGNSDATTAQFEITQIPEEGAPGVTFKGVGDFATGDMNYTLFVENEAMGERLEFGNGDAYNRSIDDDVWHKSSGAPSGDDAVTSFRNNLVASTQALQYLRSVADDVREVGREKVRGADATHYRANVRLSQLGGETQRYPVEVWVDEDGRTRRYRSQTIGTEEILVWEFFDFGVEIHLSPPPPDKVK